MLNQDASQKDSFRQSAFLSNKLTLVIVVLLISETKKGLLYFFFHATFLLVQSLAHNGIFLPGIS